MKYKVTTDSPIGLKVDVNPLAGVRVLVNWLFMAIDIKQAWIEAKFPDKKEVWLDQDNGEWRHRESNVHLRYATRRELEFSRCLQVVCDEIEGLGNFEINQETL